MSQANNPIAIMSTAGQYEVQIPSQIQAAVEPSAVEDVRSLAMSEWKPLLLCAR